MAREIGREGLVPEPLALRDFVLAFGVGGPGGRWARLALWLVAAAGLSGVAIWLLPTYLKPVAANLVMVFSPLAAGAVCAGARDAAPPEGKATWFLMVLGAMMAALGQALYARREILGEPVAFPSVGFHLLVAFHLVFAVGAILALRPALERRLAAEIAMDGALVLLGGSALVLRVILDEPLTQGWVELSQVADILIAQIAVAASLFFTALLVFWRDTTLGGRVVDGLMLTALVFAIGNVLVTPGLETLPGATGATFDPVRVVGWLALALTASLATARPQPAPRTARREVAARRFRQLIIPGAALFIAAWGVDAARRDTVSGPSLVLIALMGVLLAARIGAALYAVEQESMERRRAEARAARARLRAVTAQMNPHFLFNALHSLSALVRRDTTSTEHALERLGGLLRYGLDSGDQLVLLREEWRFARDYLALESLRLGPRLTVTTEIPEDVLDIPVPPFTLQPLVENAIRYGVNPFPEGGRVSVRARVEGAELIIEVEDSGPGADAQDVLDAPGVGLRAVRAQLEAHFEAEWRMDTVRLGDGGFLVRLAMPSDEA